MPRERERERESESLATVETSLQSWIRVAKERKRGGGGKLRENTKVWGAEGTGKKEEKAMMMVMTFVMLFPTLYSSL